MKFSLICATINRTEEVICLLNSLTGQSCQDFELVLVDQNSDDRLIPIIDSYSEQLNIKHIQSEPGLSRARNRGLAAAEGEIVAFPDDDCWYGDNLLEKTALLTEQNPEIQGITGICFDDRINKSYGRINNRKGLITKFNVWLKGSSASMFLLRDFIEQNKLNFDENLGLGSAYYSGEETDFILTMLKIGGNIYFDPEIRVGHPYKKNLMNHEMIEQGFQYGLGFGYVLRKHNYSYLYRIAVYLRSWIGMIISLLQLRINWVKYHWNSFQGRRQGYHSFGSANTKA